MFVFLFGLVLKIPDSGFLVSSCGFRDYADKVGGEDDGPGF